jgi:uncharacterized RDD family membrane protein YckC
MEYEDRRTIATPEGVQLALPLANIGSRFLALMIDSLIGLAAMIVALVATAVAGGGVGATIVVSASVLVFYVGYHVVFEVFGGGRTPGKRLARLRVVTDTGAPVGLRASLIRNVMRLLEGIGLWYLPAMIAVLATRNNQRLGDLMAGALVVRDTRPAPVPSPLPPIDPARYASWDVTGVSDGETGMVRSFIERRTELQPAARRQLAATLAGRLRPKVAGARVGLDDETFLELLAAAKARGSGTERSEHSHYPA